MSDYDDYDSDNSHTSEEDDDIVFKPKTVKPKHPSELVAKKEGAIDEEEDEEVDLEEDDDDSDISDFDEEDNEDTIFQDKPKKKTTADDAENESDEELNYASELLDDSDEEEEGESSEFYLQKFSQQLKQNVISDWHPEMKQHNMDEIVAMCTVVRDENGNVIDPLHRTLPFLTKYEKARILGERTVQLNAGATPLVKVAPEIVDGFLIAMEELAQKKIPFIIKRPMPNGGCEYWKLKDLEVLI